jgi:hypothetical protein
VRKERRECWRPGPALASADLVQRGLPSGSMRSSATAAQSSIMILTCTGGTGGAAKLRLGTAQEEGGQIASAAESASGMRLPGMHASPPRPPPHLEYCSGNPRIYELLPFWCKLAPQTFRPCRLPLGRDNASWSLATATDDPASWQRL